MTHCRLLTHPVKLTMLKTVGNYLKLNTRERHSLIKVASKNITASNTGMKSWCKNTLSKVGIVIPDTYSRKDLISAGHILLNGIYMKVITNAMIALMWQDVIERLKKLEEEVKQNLKIKKRTQEYVNLLYTTFMMYDEGILKDDCTLAGSIWNQVYGNENIDIRGLEFLVHYIRFTMARLDDIGMEVFVSNPEHINWPLPKHFDVDTSRDI